MAGAQVIHRIIGGDAKHGFIVQGDNRTAPDVWRPKPQDIVGAKALRIPNAIVVLQFLRAPIFLALLAASFVFVHVLIGTGSAAQRTTSGCDESGRPHDPAHPDRRVERRRARAPRAHGAAPRLRGRPPADEPDGDVDAMLLEPACAIGRSVLRRFGDDAPPVICLSIYPREAGPRAFGERRLPREACFHDGDRRCAPHRLRRLVAGLHCAASCRSPAAATSSRSSPSPGWPRPGA